ncbi:MAG: 2-octaprenyl-6-methoxyphenyl hydroxylase [Kistimonas sp.]|nr:2-octaprenyl-6-methoxyphenyl hydroxylase [Kistimonas sp.]
MNAQQTNAQPGSGPRPKNMDYAVVIIGAGLVGATLAVGLRRALPADFSIALVESRKLAPAGEGRHQQAGDADVRTTALSMGSCRILHEWGLWDALAAEAQPILEIQVSDRGRPGMVRLQARDHQVPALGYVVSNSQAARLLQGRLLEDAGITCLESTRVQGVRRLCELGPDCMQVETLSGGKVRKLTCSLVILADGGRSGLASMLGLRLDSRNDGQAAIVSNVIPAGDHNSIAYERFTDEGPLAFLPRSDGRCALVWTMPASLAADRMQLSEQDFLAALQSRFGYRLGRFRSLEARCHWTLQQGWLREQVRPGLVVLGNAAHSLHPVAGQGFNLSVRDIQELIHQLSRAAQAGCQLGQLDVLMRYQARRQQDQHQIMKASDRLVHSFSSNQAGWVAARTLGLVGMASLFPLKDWFARRAMGL